MKRCVGIILLGVLTGLIAGCSNNPYPEERDSRETVYYSSFSEAPKDLDPQRAYTTWSNTFLSLTYESLVAYSYLDRPLKLEPQLAKRVPEAHIVTDDLGEITEVRYPFDVRKGVRFADDACFKGGNGREMTAADIEFAFKRIADPVVNCPVFDSFAHINGFRAYRERLTKIRERYGDKPVAVKKLYAEAGAIDGVQLRGRYGIDIVMDHKYPQMLYWLAMRFVSAVPYEALEYYDGSRGSFVDGVPMEFSQRPVGTGPYVFDWSAYNREGRLSLVQNKNWWGKGERVRAPGTVYPEAPGEAADVKSQAYVSALAEKKLKLLDRIEFRMEHESLPRFNKFLQGYYDISAVPTESFDKVVQNDALSPEMQERGIRLAKDFGLDIRYIGFNMDDDQIGAPKKFADPQKEADRESRLTRNRKLRQALSLAVNVDEMLRIFYNKLGIGAQSPIPPGIFGFDPGYQNIYRQFNPSLKKAKQLLSEAGYPGGIDPATGKALRLSFVVGSTSTAARKYYGFFVDAWRKIGVNVQLEMSEYNKFQERMQEGAYQIFQWGWLADYPDPENFLFLLYGPNSGKYNPHSPNHARYESATYDALFKLMETMDNDDKVETALLRSDGSTQLVSRKEIIEAMIAHLEHDCPWIPLMHSETYLLYHGWIKGVKSHPISGSWSRYYVLDKPMRDKQRAGWNAPVLWPIWLALLLVMIFLVPAVISIRKGRR